MISSETDRHSGRRERDYISVFCAAAVKPENVKTPLPAANIATQDPDAFEKPATWTYTQLKLL